MGIVRIQIRFTSGDGLKWFKHYSDVEFSASLSKFEAELGFEGLGRYWRLVEFLSRQFTGNGTIFKIERSKLRQLLRFRSWNDLESFVDHLAIIDGIDVDRSGIIYEINSPILLDLQAKDFGKSRSDRKPTAAKNKNKKENKNDICPTAQPKVSDRQKAVPLPFDWAAVSKEVKSNWLELYSEDFLLGEIPKIKNWLVSRPEKNKKTPRGWIQFLSNWFSNGWESYQSKRSQPQPVGGLVKVIPGFEHLERD
jgi:hypothetical protein